jgi:hypothetical protein
MLVKPNEPIKFRVTNKIKLFALKGHCLSLWRKFLVSQNDFFLCRIIQEMKVIFSHFIRYEVSWGSLRIINREAVYKIA